MIRLLQSLVDKLCFSELNFILAAGPRRNLTLANFLGAMKDGIWSEQQNWQIFKKE